MSTNGNLPADGWIELEGCLHAAIEGGTMLRISNRETVGSSVRNTLSILTDGGWNWLHTITTPQQPNSHTSSPEVEAAATACLKAYAAFLYQGRLKAPIPAEEVLGHPLPNPGRAVCGLRIYTPQAAA